jgi:LysR family transcriptional regulator, low CO2-responsive transcriptional regulator
MEDVHHLRVFLAVAESLSFTRAAEHLFLTQSAVSHQIARLEREIGASLFDRGGKSISLTASGQALIPHGRRIFAAMDEASIAVRQTVRPDLGRLRIGASPSACQYIIPEALREFRESFPNYSLSIVPADSPAVIQQLLDESIDLGLAIRPDRQKRLHFHNLFIDELGFVVSPLHPWAKTAKVDRRELRDQRMVLYSRNSATFRIVDRYLTKMGAPLRDWIELGETGAIKELIKLGLGISMMAEWIVRPEVAEKSLIFLPIPSARLRRTWCVASLAGRDLSVAEQTFIGLCESVGSQLASQAV